MNQPLSDLGLKQRNLGSKRSTGPKRNFLILPEEGPKDNFLGISRMK